MHWNRLLNIANRNLDKAIEYIKDLETCDEMAKQPPKKVGVKRQLSTADTIGAITRDIIDRDLLTALTKSSGSGGRKKISLSEIAGNILRMLNKDFPAATSQDILQVRWLMSINLNINNHHRCC
jgi:hypothetical protein